MKWPFVSRRAYDQLRQQLDASEAERKDLLARLLDQPKKVRRIESAPVEEDSVHVTPKSEESHTIRGYNNPFDSTLQRFDEAHRGGKIPLEFKARPR